MKVVVVLLLALHGTLALDNKPGAKLKATNVTETLTKLKKLKASKTSAAGLMTRCLKSAKTAKAKVACETEFRKKLAGLLGKKPEDIQGIDVKGMQREQANDAAKTLMATCVAAAQSDVAKINQCRTKTGDMKQKIAEAMGKDAKDIKDTDVQKRLRDAGAKEAFLSVQTCDKSTKQKRSACDQVAKKAMANARGMSTMSTSEYKKGVKDMNDKNVAESLQTCIGDGKPLASCRQELTDIIKKGSRSGKVPSGKDVHMAIMDAKKREAHDVGAACRDKGVDMKSCFSDMKEKLKQSGKAPSDLETRRMLQTGAQAGAQEAFIACVRARQDNASATCDDFQAVANGMLGGPAPKDDKKGKINKKKLERKLSTGIMATGRKSCYEDPDVDVKQCLVDARAENKVLLDELNKGKSQARKDALTKKAERNADTQHFGQVFRACMEDLAPANATSRNHASKACMKEVKSVVDASGGNESATSMVIKAQSDIFKAISSCDRTNKTELKQCRKNAKALAKQSGVKVREILRAKKNGELRAAVEVMSACLDASNSATECMQEAKEEFLSVSGANDLGWSEAVQKKVRALAEAEVAGVLTVMRFLKGLTVVVQTTGTSCAEMEAALKAKIVAFGTNINEWKNFSQHVCRLVDSQAEHTLEVDTLALTDLQMEMHADALDQEVQTVTSSSGRRLATVTVSDSGTAQTVTECPETDNTCGTNAATATTRASGASGSASTTTGGLMALVFLVCLA